ncbi:MAG: Na+/H+ antiporter NhaC family protein [Oscillospiraceae bacterium]|nr:Na+/H+ antiporter NhaC family protein [Oscillospiraceae bacterium]
MDAIDVGILSILPPLIAIILALVTKEVISSLLIGILSGTLIYSVNTGGGFMGFFDSTLTLMLDKMGDNASIILFLAFLGALVAIVTKAGGSRAYGAWAAKKVKNRSGALYATSALGVLIFVDDYFNCLTVGTVMRPVTDKFKVSRAKLAYIIDSTAAPVCIIAPISSWAASVISQMEGTGLNGMQAFVQSIPYNLYALLSIAMVFALTALKKDFGPMAKHENAADKSFAAKAVAEDDFAAVKPSDRGRVIDLVLPVVALIVICVLSMLYVGGYFDGGMTLAEGFGETDAGVALALGGFLTLILTFLFLVPRKVLRFRDFMESIGVGIKAMVPAFIILVLAWTISGVCRDLLNTGEYVGGLVESSNMPVAVIPAIVFAVACFLSFSTGTSWGTFGILIPIVAVICQSAAPDLMIISLAATLAGAVFGDHCSPISDTTILSSTGAGCDHMTHVSTQIPYSITVAACCFVGYIVAGFTRNVFVTLLASAALLAVTLFVLCGKFKKTAEVKK